MNPKKASSLPPLSPAEQALMDLIWRKQPVSVGDLLRAVNDGRAEAITRSTLQTQLHRLETKGWLLSDDEGRARLYRSVPSEKGGRGKVLAELKQRFFGGSGLSLVRCLVEEGGLSKEEFDELNQLIVKHQQGKKP
ncbi:BlaI/MecI/CopY family transcriptional regulator [Luteolibacter yonseiensis]|uniref:BlaI/MecI/CopY family transcriptional regulator n=1 Tax=Luteolibacter yonseiensis TaxID=1144680 RepID=A0A934V967_9BACT|nr:BlaI/MecI/CopY family transcriptional regulator [Luteolibacter yonseiensis]MBK1814823.1 BlaI/MecI/CopY family transcriptional regulator [Luteolibacter yonseiensis]